LSPYPGTSQRAFRILPAAACAVASALLIMASPALAAESKGELISAHKATAVHPARPPQECAAVILSGVAEGANDGRQQAGFYKSQLGRLELHAEVTNGAAHDYRLSLAGQKLLPAPRPWPRAVTTCLQAKGVGVGAAGHDPVECHGDRFKVIMTRAASAQYLLLYAMTKPGPWRFCHAQLAPGDHAGTPGGQ
jgi:hypothetical protein